MINGISNKLSESLVINGIIEKEDIELYSIGFQCGFIAIANILYLLIIGAFMHILTESAIFILSFFVLRICANGFHMKSILSCFWFSCVVEFAVLLGIKYLPFNAVGAILTTVILAVICGWFSPVPNENKQYTETESNRFRNLSLMVFGIEFTIGLVFWLVNLTSLFFAILYGWALYSLLNVLGHAQNHLKNGKPTN